MTIRDTVRRFDWTLLAGVFLLFVFGTMAIASVALANDPPDWRNTTKHLIFIGAGLLILFFGSQVDYRALRAWNRASYLGGVLLLIIVLFLGATIRGTRSWFAFAGVTVQPVELAKVFFLIFLATYFERWARESDRIRHVLLSGAGAFVYIALIMFQPDVGSAFIFFLVWLGMLCLVGVRRRHLALLGVVIAAVCIVGWFALLQEYQRDRIRTFFSPGSDPLGRGYNITQARIAIGSGQLFGRGFGFGSQSQLRFLPEAETDFVFAVVAEELGLVGASVLLLGWGIIFWRLFRALRRAADDFALFFLTATLLLFFIEASVTIGMNVGLMPVTGVTLPFVSYGGSSLLSHFVLISIVQSILIRNPSFTLQ